eukprot:gene927-1798_t
MSFSFATVAVHAGSEPDGNSGAVTVPISLSTTFSQNALGMRNGVEDVNSFGKGYEYSRTGNPTRGAFERALAACEKGSYCCAFASGLAATSSILQTLKSGDHVICVDDVYGGTQRYFRQIVSPNTGITFSFINMENLDNIEAAVNENTKLIWVETPTNPLLKIIDIKKVSTLAKNKGILLCVDNTFMSPYLQNPLSLGADLVMHSVTKYIGGHSDVVMGAIITNSEDLYTKLRFIQNGVGAVPSPFDCYLAHRGLKTLHLRMEAAMKNAITIAQFLETHPLVEKVIYPGLTSHPQYELCKEQASGPGAMITFYVKGNLDATGHFLTRLKVFTLAESLGAVESLIEAPALMTHASVPADKRLELGISDNMVRISVGIEHVDDLLEDLRNALS